MTESSEFRNPWVVGEQAARALRLDVDLGFAPISGPHLWSLIAERGVDLGFNRIGTNAGDALYLWDGERGLIVLNLSGRKATRLRFTAAHELGHHEMHRHSVAKLILSDSDTRHADTDVEKEANSFAAELLAPAAALRKELADKTSEEVTPVEVVQLMRTYGISYQAMIWRLFNARLITAGDRKALEDQGAGRVNQLEAALGFNEDVLFGPPTQTLPEDYVLNALAIHREGAIDDSRLADLLRVKKADAVKLASEIEPTISPDGAEIDRLLGLRSRASK